MKNIEARSKLNKLFLTAKAVHLKCFIASCNTIWCFQIIQFILFKVINGTIILKGRLTIAVHPLDAKKLTKEKRFSRSR